MDNRELNDLERAKRKKEQHQKMEAQLQDPSFGALGTMGHIEWVEDMKATNRQEERKKFWTELYLDLMTAENIVGQSWTEDAAEVADDALEEWDKRWNK